MRSNDGFQISTLHKYLFACVNMNDLNHAMTDATYPSVSLWCLFCVMSLERWCHSSRWARYI